MGAKNGYQELSIHYLISSSQGPDKVVNITLIREMMRGHRVSQ